LTYLPEAGKEVVEQLRHLTSTCSNEVAAY